MKAALLSIAALFIAAPSLFAVDRPNIVWISCEDISPKLGCYGDPTATTPHLDQLASEGIRYTHAFSCHGVCAPSRTGIITGHYPIALGANHMRSKARLPPHIRPFPQYLREAGYYCTNNSKTDYNIHWNQKATWDDTSKHAHWKNRKNGAQPFFSVFNLTMTHESKIWLTGWKDVASALQESERHRPEAMIVPPLYPDSQPVREDLARLSDIITVMDRRAGEILEELNDAGLSENTIVFFWSDHGNGLPRAKRWTYDSGTRVPLIVRVHEKYKSLATDAPSGSTDDRLLNLIDLGPTVLSLAGVNIPEGLSGQPFLGGVQSPDRVFIYGARDRIDERFDMVRSVRSRDFRYVRNLMPWHSALQHVAYGEQNATLTEWRRLVAAGKLAPRFTQWFESPHGAEELYDLNSDPWEMVNLAQELAHAATLRALSEECDRWQLECRDAHLLPESLLDTGEQEAGSRWDILRGPDGLQRAKSLLAAAKSTAHSIASKSPALLPTLDADPAVRWWQLMACSRAVNVAEFRDLLKSELKSDSAALRIAAAGGLARAHDLRDAAGVLGKLLGHESVFVRHAAILEIDEAGSQLIELTKQQIKLVGDDEYCERLADHALNR